MKIINILFWLSWAMALPAVAMAKGGSVGNGGAGCIATNGQVITFYDCGVLPPKPTTEPPDMPLPIDGTSEQPPGLAELISYIQGYPYLKDSSKATIVQALTPSIYRKYFSVVPADLTSQVQGRLLFQFKRATGFDPDHLKLYGVTDVNAKLSYVDHPGQITYLLPGFYKLRNLHEQMAALFHETWWVMFPNTTEDQAVAAEVAFQAALDDPQSALKALGFVNLFEGIPPFEKDAIGFNASSINAIKLMFKTDLDSGALRGFVDADNRFTNLQLFDKDAIACLNAIPDNLSAEAHNQAIVTCHVLYVNYLNGLRRQYPKSLVLQLVGKFVIASGPWISFEDVFEFLEGGSDYTSKTYDYNHNCFLFVCHSEGPADPLERTLFPNAGEYSESFHLQTELVFLTINTSPTGWPLQ